MTSISIQSLVDVLHRTANGFLELEISNSSLLQLKDTGLQRKHSLLQLHELLRDGWNKCRIDVNLFYDEFHCFARVPNCFLTLFLTNIRRLLHVFSFQTTKFESANSISCKICESLTRIFIRIGMLVHRRLKSN